MLKRTPLILFRVLLSSVALFVVLSVGIPGVHGNKFIGAASADAVGCDASSLDTAASTYGKATQTVVANSAGTYRVWSRIDSPSSDANSYYLQIDNGCPIVVGDSAQTPVNNWTWINYQNADTASTIDVSLTAGSHTFTYVGRETGVVVDKILALADTACVPTGTGDNCAIVDTTAPLVSIVSPTPDFQVQGSVDVQATVYDLSAITKVEFYVDGNLQSTVGVSGSYSFAWDSTSVPNGSHSFQIKAYDDAVPSNVGSSSAVSVNVNNPPAVGALDVQSSLILDKSTVSVGDVISATAIYKNNSDFPVTVDDIMLSARLPIGDNPMQQDYFKSTDNGPYTVAPGQTIEIGGAHIISTDEPSGQYWAHAEYIDTAGNVHADATETSFTVLAPDTTAPAITLTAPVTGTTVHEGDVVDASADASDDVAVSKVEAYVNGVLAPVQLTSPYHYLWDTTNVAVGNYDITFKAYDAAGNTTFSSASTVTVLPPPDTTKPTVSITKPDLNVDVRVGDTSTISATASDDVGVSSVEIYVDGNLLTTLTTAPYNYDWDTTGVTVGAHSITAKAYDAAGNTKTSIARSVNIVPQPDTIKPTVAVAAPTANASIISGDDVAITIDAADNVAVTAVEIFVDGQPRSEILSAPYTLVWNTASSSIGDHAISAAAVDAAGNIAQTAPLTVHVVPPPDVTKPTVAISAPTDGSSVVVTNTVAITADASDDTGVAAVEFYVDGNLQSTVTDAPYTYVWDTTGATVGNHSITAKAYDAAENETDASAVTVNVLPPPDTTKPTLALLTPVDNSSIIIGNLVDITTDASDNVGVTKVEFYIDGSPRSETETAPYSHTWNTIGTDLGPHTITIKAYDAAGNVGELSATITIIPVPDTTAPTAAITAPDTDTSTIIGTPLTITADASDDFAVTKVEISIDGDLKATLTDSPYSYTWDTTDVALGTHTIAVQAYDAAGNTKTASRTTTVIPVPDTANPTVSIADPDDGIEIITGTNSFVNIDAADNFGVVKVELSIDDTVVSTLTADPYTYDWDTTGLSLGAHTLLAKAYDAAGNVGQSSVVNFTIVPPSDTAAPSVAITAPSDGSSTIIGDDVAITATASDNVGVSKVEFFVDGAPRSETAAEPYALTWNTVGTSLGAHTIMVRASDAAGNASQTTTTVNIIPVPDTTKPNISVTSPSAGANIITGDTTAIALDASDDFGVTKVEVLVDGALEATLTDSPYSYTWDTTGAELGDHVITASAYDAAGNVGQASSVTVTIVPPPDVTKPVVAIATPTDGANIVTGDDIAITADASDNVGVSKLEIFIDGLPRSEMQTAPYAMTWGTVGTSLGAHTIMVRASDAAGNSDTSTVTINIVPPPDTTSPTVSVTSPSSDANIVTGTTSAIALAASDNVGVTSVELSIDGSQTATMTTSPYTYSWDTTGFNLGTHTLLAKAYDAAGNVGESSSVTFTIVPVPDTTKPTASITAPVAGANIAQGDSAAITANASDNVGVTQVEVFIDDTSKSVLQSAPYTYTWSTSTATSLGTHTILVRASDAAGNTSDSTVIINIVPPPDLTAPSAAITTPAANASIIVGTAVPIDVTATDDIGVTKVDFQVDAATKNSDTTSPYSYTWDSTGASIGTHTLGVIVYDAAGNTTLVPVSVNIVPVPDTTKPTVSVTSPASGSSIVTGASSAITLSAADDTAVTKVELSIDGTLKTTLTTAPYAYTWDTTGTSLGTHSITAKAYDAAGNTQVSTAVSVTIVPPPDTTKPTITITAPTAGSNIAQGNNVTINAAASDDVGVTLLAFSIDGQPRSEMQSAPYTLVWNTIGSALGSHTITARATDAAGNYSDSTVTINIVTPPDTTAPTVVVTAPAANANVITTTTIPLSATASDNVGVSKVEFYVDGTLKGTSTTSPYSYSWNTTGATAASHTVTAKAYDAAGNTTTTAGTPITITDPGGTGLQATYYNNMDLTGTTFSRLDQTVNFDWSTGSPNAAIDADTFSARWTGFVKPTTTETYTFLTQTDEGVRLWVNGVLVIDNWTAHIATLNRGTINLTANTKYSIKLEYYENTGVAVSKLFWSAPTVPQGIIPRPLLYAN